MPTIRHLGPGSGHETGFFMRMVSMMMLSISRVDAKILIIVVRVIAMIMSMVQHGLSRGVFDQRMTALGHERKHQRGEHRQHGHQQRSESSSTAKLHGVGR